MSSDIRELLKEVVPMLLSARAIWIYRSCLAISDLHIYVI